jgi:hypothetical protein
LRFLALRAFVFESPGFKRVLGFEGLGFQESWVSRVLVLASLDFESLEFESPGFCENPNISPAAFGENDKA